MTKKNENLTDSEPMELSPMLEEVQAGCSFPNCGCPEARLCMAKDPNESAFALCRPPSNRRAKEIAMEREATRLGMTLKDYQIAKYGTTYIKP